MRRLTLSETQSASCLQSENITFIKPAVCGHQTAWT